MRYISEVDYPYSERWGIFWGANLSHTYITYRGKTTPGGGQIYIPILPIPYAHILYTRSRRGTNIYSERIKNSPYTTYRGK